MWTVEINRPPTEVYTYLADVRRHAEWSPKAFRVEEVSAGPVAKGTTFVSYGWIPGDKEHRNEVEVSEMDPPAKLVLTSKEPKGDVFVNTFTITGSDSGSRVEREMDMPVPGGVMGAVFPLLLRGYIRPAIQKGMDKLRENLESGSRQ